MSTRKSLNKQNADSPIPGAQDSTVLRSSGTAKSSQELGSESEPSTPTSRDSNSTPAPDSKRKRRTNSIQSSMSTPKKANENTDTVSAAELEDKNPTKRISDEINEDSTNLDSPKTRKRRVFDKSAIVTRKSTSDLAKNSVRALRGIARKSSTKAQSPKETNTNKRGPKKKGESASTPLKRKREDSNQSEGKDEEMPAEKLIKVEKIDLEYEEQDEVNLMKIKMEMHAEMASEELKEVEMLQSSEIKSELIPEDNEQKVLIGKAIKKEATKQKRRKSAPAKVIKKTTPKVVRKPKEPAPTPPRRGRPPKQVAATASAKPGRKSKKLIEPKKPFKSPVPKNLDITKTEVPESIKDVIKCEFTEPIITIDKPLTVDTTNSAVGEKSTIANTSSATGSDKAASLSPAELVSEGVSEISVKQFYKKPEFLENNLGIEQDPKLGGIVQKVEKDSTKNIEEESTSKPTIKAASDVVNSENYESDPNASDSLKEGELLVLEDSTEEEMSRKDDSEQEAPVLVPETITTTGIFLDEKQAAPELENEAQAANIDPEIVNEIPVAKNIEIKNDVCDLETNTAVDSKNIDEVKNIKKECDDIKLNIEECEVEDVKKDQAKMKDITEPPSKIIKDLIVAADIVEDVGDDEDTKRKECTALDSTQMEIDSGVSDIAENNSSDPNDDLSLLQEIIEDGDDLKAQSIDVVVENKENINEIKGNQENIRISDVSIISEKSFQLVKSEQKKTHETPETIKQKENHLKSLGLLTLKAADEAKIEKQKRRELFKSTASTSGGKKINGNGYNDNPSGNGNKSSQEYTGTLKTVIKLNRPVAAHNLTDKRKGNSGGGGGGTSGIGLNTNGSAGTSTGGCGGGGRLPLKMTFQKGRGKGSLLDRSTNHSIQSTEDTYYTIQNETEAGNQETVTQHGRKSHNRSHNSEQPNVPEVLPPVDKKEEKKETIVIPEKASSFSIHPGRLCQDQCFYCGGKFGLYDTPCHVAQLKSLDRQKKILDNEEKLTVDNCLCDACFRHVDRRANVPSYKKRLSTPATLDNNCGGGSDFNSSVRNDSIEGNGTSPIPPGHTLIRATCFVTSCKEPASHTFRRKGFRKTIRKLLGDDLDLSNLGGRLPICDRHYEVIIQCLECALCKRRLVKNHMYHITQDVQQLEKLLMRQGIPVKLYANPAVCKLCRYFTNLLVKPPEGKTQKAQFVKNYRRRLLHFHNIQSDDASDVEEQTDNKNTSAPPVPAKRGRKPKNIAAEISIESRKSSCNESTPISSEEDVEEVTNALTTSATSGQMILDNDVMVDYDVPVICDTPSPPAAAIPSKLQTILQGGNVTNKNDDISIVLRSNPNISMRELFPGEEEMGLNVQLPFGGSTAQRTPEGWTRIQTFLQYDEPTRRLWEDLQKPYGNQSSFLRHLILLEKYFRNGDLMLSQNASTNAVVYSETVQNRLRSYDNNCSTISKTTASSSANNQSSSTSINKSNHNSRPTVSQILRQPEHMKKLNNLTITITPKPKQTTATATNTKNSTSTISSNITVANSGSILKSNLLGRKNSAIEIIPIGAGSNNSNNNGSALPLMTKQQKILAAASQLMSDDKTPSTGNMAKLASFPPELISINRGGSNALLVGGGGRGNSSTNITANNNNKSHSIQSKWQQQQSVVRPGTSKLVPATIIKLPETLTQQERMSSKNWRPTLMPIQSGPVKSVPGVLYQTADGRKLPSLVQVQSGGRPFLISIHDYNRMCLLRREKIVREQMLKRSISGPGPGASNSKQSKNKVMMSDAKQW